MKSPLVAVISYGDREYRQAVKNALDDYHAVRIKHFEICTPECLRGHQFDFVLINADQFHLRPRRGRKLLEVVNCGSVTSGPIIMMLTNNLSATDFLRNQVYRVTDTIDIGTGMGVLKVALNAFMIRKRSYDSSGDNGANYNKA
jgi:hypothetical protein